MIKHNKYYTTTTVSIIFTSFLSVFSCQVFAQQYVSKVWVSDNGDGTYKNPVIYADYSDPDVCRVGDDFYLTASSFTCSPALPILHSKDLVNWKLINYALKKQVPSDVFDKVQQTKGVWAPAIRFHNGEYYIYYPDPDFGIYMTKTKNPAGEWEKPVLVVGGKGLIDPCPLWDDNGAAYLVYAYAGSRTGVNSVLAVFKMNTDGTCVLDDAKIIYDGHEHNPTVEGPKFYKRNGYYYIFAPAGGVKYGWQLVLRSRDVYGPYEEKIVMDQGKSITNGPHQGAWIDTQTGEDWFIHFQDKDAYGRVTHLQPVKWVNDWPVIGVDKDGDGKGEPVLTYKKPNVGKSYPVCTPSESDEFITDTLGLQWQWNANVQTTWYSLIRGKQYLRLYSVKQTDDNINFWSVPNVLMQKFPAPDFTVTTKLRFVPGDEGTSAGLLILGRDYSRLSLGKSGRSFKLSLFECKNADTGMGEKIIDERQVPDSVITLRVHITSPDAMCSFSYSTNDKDFISLGIPLKARQGGWIGSKVGIYCISDKTAKKNGYADFDWFRIDKR